MKRSFASRLWKNECWIHATFRDAQGHHVHPEGLQWSMEGTSQIRYVVPPTWRIGSGDDVEPSPEAILHATNRWNFAKDLPFQTLDDIVGIDKDGPHHWNVEWKKKDSSTVNNDTTVIHFEDIAKLLQEDSQTAAANETSSSWDVWIQGEMIGPLNPQTVQDIIDQIPTTKNRLVYKRSPGRIRIERHYRGMLRKPQVWDHIWDNLLALEDVQSPEENVFLGTATLKDWVMGGYLTSRLYVHDRGDSIQFLRPLRNKDDLSTSDRRYTLTVDEGDDDHDDENEGRRQLIQYRMELTRQELDRFRYLATLDHPYQFEGSISSTNRSDDDESSIFSRVHQDRIAAIRKKLGHGNRRQTFFGI